MPKEFPFGIGADPEFNIVYQDQRLHAQKIISELFKNKMSDGGFKVAGAGLFGWDGMSETGELRPTASNKPEQVVKNIGKLFQAFVNNTKLLSLTAKTDKAPVGGHIHLQIDSSIARSNQKMSILGKRLSSFFVPEILANDPIAARLRLKMSYGRMTDWRASNPAANINTFEYRAPSGEWLVTPQIAEATLAFAATIFNEILHHPKNFAKANELVLKTDEQASSIQNLALSHFNFIAEIMCKKIRKVVRTFEYYKDYQDQIEYFLKPEKVLADKQKVNFDILKGWKLEQPVKLNKKIFLSDSELQKKARVLDIETMRKVIPVPFNEDMNIEVFAEALRSRIVAHEYRTKHTYFLFGLRQGINGFQVKDNNCNWIRLNEILESMDDLVAMNNIFDKMGNRCRDALRGNGIDTKGKSIFLIGIPYNLRQTPNTKSFIELIYDLEKNPTPPLKIPEMTWKADTRINQIFSCRNSEELVNLIAQNNWQVEARQEEVATEMRSEEAVLSTNLN